MMVDDGGERGGGWAKDDVIFFMLFWAKFKKFSLFFIVVLRID